jgi:intracellular septation protein
MSTSTGRARAKQRPLLDLGPLLVFFAANWLWGIYVATGVLIVAAALAMLIAWRLDRHVSPMMIFTTVAVLVFGGLTIALRDQRFIQIKLTVVYALLAGVLLGGLVFRRAFLKTLLDQAFALTDEGWRRLTLRFALFFLFLALLNEVLRRHVTLDTWVSFKVFGVLGLTLVFTLLQLPLIQRHARAEER